MKSIPDSAVQTDTETATTQSPVTAGDTIVDGASGSLTLLYADEELESDIEVEMIDNIPAHESPHPEGHCVVAHPDWDGDREIAREHLSVGVAPTASPAQ